MNTPAIQVVNLSKSYGNVLVLDDISFEVPTGSIVGLVGPNGAGKTTLLESIEGLRKIQTGNIKVLGKFVATEYKAIQKEIGIQLQRTSLMGDLTLKETLRLFTKLYRVKNDTKGLLDKVDLAEFANKKVKHLSGGQYQRFNLCLAILNNPKILFLDEPTTGLDPIARKKLWEIIEELRSQNVTIVITTHYMDEAEVLCDKIIMIYDHKIVANDSPQNLINQLDNEKTITVDGLQDLTSKQQSDLTKNFKYKYIEDQLFLYTYNIGESLNVLFDWLKQEEKEVNNIAVRSANLEDVFMKYTSTKIDKEGMLL